MPLQVSASSSVRAVQPSAPSLNKSRASISFELETTLPKPHKDGLSYLIPLNIVVPQSDFERLLPEVNNIHIDGLLELPILQIVKLIAIKSTELAIPELKLMLTLTPKSNDLRRSMPVIVSTSVDLRLMGTSIEVSDFRFKDLELFFSKAHFVLTEKGTPRPAFPEGCLQPSDVAKDLENNVRSYLNTNQAPIIKATIQRKVDKTLSSLPLRAGLLSLTLISNTITFVPWVLSGVWSSLRRVKRSQSDTRETAMAHPTQTDSIDSPSKTTSAALPDEAGPNIIELLDSQWFGRPVDSSKVSYAVP